ncbi:hypothetical protein Tco_1091302 [Tanacetum coccineum]|uniref:Uncharacterized protein n=1 Tax=Tanacetum coccineum TaxID=301880 RepID=A0ABQ5I6Q4_9ASTR
MPKRKQNNGKHSLKSSTQIQYCCFNISTMDLLRAILTMLNYFRKDCTIHLNIHQTLIPFSKVFEAHLWILTWTAYHEISRRVSDKYHNFENDDIVKSIFNSGKNKAGVGMKIPSCMITDEMKLTENYRMYVSFLGLDVPTTQSQPI